MARVGVIGARQFAGIPTMLIASGSMRRRDAVLKRMLDLALVLPTLIFLAPLLVLTALAVRLDSPGPVLFMQQRVGRGNRLFNVLKFRSMHTSLCDHAGNVSVSRLDKRITRIGRFIRGTSIDELPQLLNILRGEMSFVGPRPHAIGSLAGDALFWEVDHRYHHRHACKPGLTGLAQVRGFRGATHRREDLINRLHADLEYTNGWSVWRDLSILLATVKVVVHRNAY
jgi:lipopolysaccharide/colanic/teichoic acid biosynthesis glycosyltransferase